MGSDIVVSHSRRVGLPAAAEAQRMWQLAGQIQHTDLVPRDFRGKPEAVLACALAGREIGLGFFEALRSFYVVDGRPSESAELLHTLALRAGHDIWVESATHSAATVRGRHRDWPDDRPDAVVEWTVQDAAQAELVDWECLDAWPRHNLRDIVKHKRDGGTFTKRDACECKDNWRKYGRAMFRSRGITEMVRMVCPEVTVGATYTPEELGAVVEGPGGVPVGAVPGWGASGEDFELPEPADVDGMWVAQHTPDQVLAMVDHYGPELIVPEAGHVRLAVWVRRCEESGEKRPRLIDGLAVRVGEDPPDREDAGDGEDVVDAETVCGDCGGPYDDEGKHSCDVHRADRADQARAAIEDTDGGGDDEPDWAAPPSAAADSAASDGEDTDVAASPSPPAPTPDDEPDRRPIVTRASDLGLGIIEVRQFALEAGHTPPNRMGELVPNLTNGPLLEAIHDRLDVEQAERIGAST